MRFISLTFPALCAAAAVSKSCENPTKRVEWREFDDAARQQYTDAVLCLSTKPSRLGLNTTLYDDFPFLRRLSLLYSVASFLPWHRYFVHVYEGALKECGYREFMPTSPSMPTTRPSPPKTGFGGNGSLNKAESIYNGRAVRKCLDDVPFKDLVPAYLTTNYDPHCLARGWNDGSEQVGDMLSDAYTKEAVAKVQEIKGYDEYRQKLEGGPHGAIHSAIGGDMIPNTSPNDPIFFLHHAQIYRLWSLWQEEDPKTRSMEFTGFKTQDQFDGTKPPPASLDDTLLMKGLADDLKVKDLMRTQSSLLCYSY
ncbi:Tyrosinase [Fusarium odoratissimum]|uniref:Tyrosinase n=1 Tax=Fusarium oxysporum f. sp. cubense (strain race 4) TaxID=2502994 RepID=N1S8Q1_FUSC4|nr:Tyrosinase [Fusarium odoratissimum]